jgi:hypothetical protein
VAVVTATLAMPFLVLDNANSAAGDPEEDLIVAGAPFAGTLGDPGVAVLGARAEAWSAARAELMADNVELAAQLAEQSRLALEAQIAQLADSQRSVDEAAATERERAAAQAREAEAARQAAEAAARRTADAPAAASAATTTTTTTTSTTTTAPPPPAGPTPDQWAALRACESNGNYQAVSSTGRFRGAYQFSQPTWDFVAGTVAPHLVGQDPAAAAPADQDLLARTLHGMRGSSPWPTCGVHIRG